MDPTTETSRFLSSCPQLMESEESEGSRDFVGGFKFGDRERLLKKYGGSLTHRLILTDSRHCATILACLKENRPKLTPACRTVMVSHGQ